jgi:predicted DsbA family dithiol-disulfide isomerase
MKALSVDVWSDIACPWCYVGKRRLEAALQRFAERDAVEITWRAFELDPAAPRVVTPRISYAERLARKYGTGLDRAERMILNMTELARADGLVLDFEHIQPGNTFDAHRVIHLARERGLASEVKERLFRAYLSEGQAIGDPDVLVRVGAEAGLDGDEVGAVLASDAHARAVRAEEAEATEIGIQGVPFFVVARRYAVSGAQPADLLLGVLERAANDPALEPIEPVENTQCGPEGCV